MVPAHLTLSQLSKIMLDSSVSFKIRYGHTPASTETLDSLYSKMSDDRKGFELQNCIVDLEYEMN
jgi:hypothetical protein